MERVEIASKEFDNGYVVSLSKEMKKLDNNPHCLILRLDTRDGEVYETNLPYVPGKKVAYVPEKYFLNGYIHFMEEVTEIARGLLSDSGYELIDTGEKPEILLDHSKKIVYRNENDSDKIIIYKDFDSPEEARYFTIASEYLGIGGVYIGNMKDINEFARLGNKGIVYHRDFHRDLF